MAHIRIHTKTLPDGSVIDILKLQSLLETRKVISMPNIDIKLPSKSKRTGFSYKRLKDADVSYPLIIDDNRFLIDGRHRFFKMFESGTTVVQVKIATMDDLNSVLIKNTLSK